MVSILHDAEKLKVEWNDYVIHKMAAIPAASDALNKYVGQYDIRAGVSISLSSSLVLFRLYR